MKRIVTLTTDFGQGDYDTGVLAGVVLRLAPEARVIDLSHAVGRHNVLEGALLLDRCTPYFPEGTIHIAVVDPGVGTARRAVAARLGRQCFVGPDNGLITLMRARALSAALMVEIVQLNRPEYWLAEVSPIFHGRDIFAPVAGHLAAGTPLEQLGDFITDPVLLEIPEPQRTPSGWRGMIMHVDAFGNLSTNLAQGLLAGAGRLKVRVRTTQIDGLVRTFGEGAPGDLVALYDSSGKLSVCVVNGNAARRIEAQVGDPVEVIVE
jgi:S-adenosylmethionine hydrolase